MPKFGHVMISAFIASAINATSSAAITGSIDFIPDSNSSVLVTRGLETFAIMPGADIKRGDILTNTLSSTATVTALGCSVEMNKAEQIIVDDSFCTAEALVKISSPLHQAPAPVYQTTEPAANLGGGTSAVTTAAEAEGLAVATTTSGSTATAASGTATSTASGTAATVSASGTTVTAATATATVSATSTAASTGIFGLGVAGTTAAVVATAAIISQAVSN